MVRTIEAGAPDIRIRSGRTEQADDLCAIAGIGIALERFVVFAERQHRRPLHDRRDRLDHVGSLGDQCRALLEQVVGAGGARIERRARHGKDLAALFGRHPRRDQRTRALGWFDHDDAERGARDQAVAPGKVARARGS
jgi:hypothetical protein